MLAAGFGLGPLLVAVPKGPKYLYGTKYGFCSSNFPYGLGKYTPYGYLGPFGCAVHRPGPAFAGFCLLSRAPLQASALEALSPAVGEV